MADRTANTSRAFWELKAEQIMDRVFMPAMAGVGDERIAEASPPARALAVEDDSIEVEVREAPAAAPAVAAAPPPRPRGAWRRPALRFNTAWQLQPWQIGGLACLALGTSATLWLGWNQANQDLRQERTIRLLEGIRGLNQGEADSRTGTAAAANASQPGGTSATDGLPPPPPDEPWIEELGQLDGQGRPGGAAPLQVPVNGTLRAPAPVASGGANGPLSPPPPVPGGGGSSPELVGVVQIPGRPGSAIFQVGGSSTNASAGETIGSSGWRLVSTTGDSAVIERGGVSRRVSISSGF